MNEKLIITTSAGKLAVKIRRVTREQYSHDCATYKERKPGNILNALHSRRGLRVEVEKRVADESRPDLAGGWIASHRGHSTVGAATLEGVIERARATCYRHYGVYPVEYIIVGQQ